MKFATTSLLALLLASCTPHIVGTWNIASYEIIEEGKDGVSANNVGQMVFKKDKSGTSQITFNLLGATGDGVQKITWNLNKNLLTIKPEGATQSKTWIISEKSCKSQTLNATNGASQVQVLVLKKLKAEAKKK